MAYLPQVSEKNAEIRHLRSTIKGVVNLAEDGNRRVKAEAHDKQVSEQNEHTIIANKLKEEIGSLKKKLKEVVKENQEKENNLRKAR